MILQSSIKKADPSTKNIDGFFAFFKATLTADKTNGMQSETVERKFSSFAS